MKGKVTLYIDGNTIEFELDKLLEADQSPSKDMAEKVAEFLYTYVSNQ